ncbi:MAG: cytidine deaminase [Clostridiales bacterium]|nr:cytidine deaminase [Clostridiales bacterium]
MPYDEKALIQLAVSARENAYCPYSHFAVGAALLGESGRTYAGANCENAAFGAGVCAERAALAAAVTAGERRFCALVVVSGGEEPASPCGICRQMLSEFGDMEVICASPAGEIAQRERLSALLPHAFLAFEAHCQRGGQ